MPREQEADPRRMDGSHPRWREFLGRLEGPEGCNFREEDGKTVWNCGGGRDKSLSDAILRSMGLTKQAVWASFDYFDEHGGHCDCEVIFNVDRDPSQEGASGEAGRLVALLYRMRAVLEKRPIASAALLDTLEKMVAEGLAPYSIVEGEPGGTSGSPFRRKEGGDEHE